MAMLIAPDGSSRDALLAALEGGDVRSVSPDHPDFFASALNAGAIVYAPGPPADPERMRRVLGACNAPGVTMIVFVRTPDDAFEPEERLLRRDGKPYVVLAAPPGSPALGPALRRALSEGELQGRVLELKTLAPEPASAAPTPPAARAATKLEAPAEDAEAPPEPARPASKRREPARTSSSGGDQEASSKLDAPPGRPSTPPSASPPAPWRRWLLPAVGVALLVALQAMGVRIVPSGCSAVRGPEGTNPSLP